MSESFIQSACAKALSTKLYERVVESLFTQFVKK